MYLEADAADVDQARAKAIRAATVPAPSEPPMSLATIRAEIARLSSLALAMQAEQEAA